MLAAREFPDTWGFLCGPKIEPANHGFRSTIAKYHGGKSGDWHLAHKRIRDDSELGLMARKIDNDMKPKMGTVLQGTEHRTNIVPGIIDKYGRKLTTTNMGYDCIPNRSAALALRSHYEHTIGDTVCIRGYNPNEKYKYPVSSSQEVGWRPKTLEVFGVAEFGLKKGIAAMHGYK
mmetsp:Transcript_21911/g.64646  ORF Transcript_21911/g.64646 Transcript_21911/m.64646 type:complete len:175 (+) Transcript_21911:239-763(+)